MTTPRRRLGRPPAGSAARAQLHQRKSQKLRARLARERAALERWQAGLKRAFTAVQKAPAAVVRLERQLPTLRDGGA